MDGTLKIWDLVNGHIMYTLYGHEGATTCTNFSPNGDFMVSGGSDNNVMIWTCPLDSYKGEIIEGIDYVNNNKSNNNVSNHANNVSNS